MGSEKKKVLKTAKADQKKQVKSLKEALKLKASASNAAKSKAPAGAGGSGGGKGGGGKKKGYQKSWDKYAKKNAADKKDGSKGWVKPKVDVQTRSDDKKTSAQLKKARSELKPNFKLVEGLKTSWNKVRIKSTPEDVRKDLLVKMVQQMTGNVLQVTLRHDASRITQCILQFGSSEQRQVVLGELVQKSVEIAKTPYVLILIEYLCHGYHIEGSHRVLD